MKKLITVIAPMYNEQGVVEQYTSRTLAALSHLNSEKYSYEILFVNDGAKDNTLKLMYKMQTDNPQYIGVVNLTRNFGLEGAIYAGLKTTKGDVVITMDADLQDPPEIFAQMIEKYEQGADIVVAKRATRKSDNWFKRVSAANYYKVLDSLSGKLKLERNAANFRLLSRRAVDTVLSLPEVNPTYRVNVPFIGLPVDTVEYDRNDRAAGVTNYNVFSLIRCALDGITAISIEPLRKIFWTIPICTFIMGLSLIGWIFMSEEWTKTCILLFVLSFLFTLLFIVIAIVGEYIGQIMIETKGRPISIVHEYHPSHNSKEL